MKKSKKDEGGGEKKGKKMVVKRSVDFTHGVNVLLSRRRLTNAASNRESAIFQLRCRRKPPFQCVTRGIDRRRVYRFTGFFEQISRLKIGSLIAFSLLFF